jgi:hypothetical protein
MKGPEVREALYDLADIIEAKGLPDEADKLRLLTLELRRRSPVRRGREVTQRISNYTKNMIRTEALLCPQITYQELAIKHGIRNAGRISEIVAGYRT